MVASRAMPTPPLVERLRARARVLGVGAAALALAGAALPMPLAGAGAAHAAGETLAVNLSVQDGTPAWDAADGDGLDSSPENRIIRTNDQATYRVEVSSQGGEAEHAILTLVAPKGQEFRDIPAWCDAVGEPGADATPTPSPMPEPEVPLTATSWESLPQQTLQCSLGTLPANSAQFYEVPVFQRAEVPNGTTMGSLTAEVVSDAVTTPVAAPEDVSLTVSSGPRWDLSKNSTTTLENRGYFYSQVAQCSFDRTRSCYHRTFAILISGENDGKGLSPMTGPVTFTDRLSPESFYGADVMSSPAWQAAGADALDRYAPRLAACSRAHLFDAPNEQLGDPATSVRQSGQISCSQPTLGGDVDVTITGTDWSLYTAPTEISNPAKPIPDDRAYAVSMRLAFEVPADAVRDLGTEVNGVDTLAWRNEYTPLQGTALDGTPQAPADDPAWNNYREATIVQSLPGTLQKMWAGIPGVELNTPPSIYAPFNSIWEGPPGDQELRSGTFPAGAGQEIISVLTLGGSDIANPADGTALICDTWDSSRLRLHAWDVPGSAIAAAQALPSGGEAVWMSGTARVSATPEYTVEYGTGPSGTAGTDCAQGAWYASPEEVPGNDPALLAQGVYSAVNQVRITTTVPRPTANALRETYQYFSIALQVVPGQGDGDIVPNWAGGRWDFTGSDLSRDELLAGATPRMSSYDPATNTGGLGDRLIFAPSTIRVAKSVSVNGGEFGELLNATAGDPVVWKIEPKLSTAALAGAIPQPVTVEECLPSAFVYESASIQPSIAQAAPAPADAELPCEAGTYLRFVIEAATPNQAIEPIMLSTRVSETADPGTFTNTASAQTEPGDPSPLRVRQNSAQVAVQQVAGIKLEKLAVTPVVQLNGAGPVLEENVWRIELSNVKASEDVRDVDIIDVLPVTSGENGSRFSGSMQFSSAEVVAGDQVTLLFTSSRSVVSNPDDASNQAAGIAWCDAPAGGRLVTGQGECPAAASEVTGLRLQRPGVFADGMSIEAEVTMVASGNAAGDVYANVVEASADGLVNNVGPKREPEAVVASSVGDRVWDDLDQDGVQDEGEPGIAGFPVALAGFDDLGNPVALATRTDADGRYRFDGLRSGDYTVTFDPAGLPAGATFTLQHAGEDRAADSDGDPATGSTGRFVLDPNQGRTDLDQGVIVPVPPTTTPPAETTPPVTTPPVTTPPVETTPPVTTPPAVTTPPVTTPPAETTPPTTTPPAETAPPTTLPPVPTTPPADVPPSAQPPAGQPPSDDLARTGGEWSWQAASGAGIVLLLVGAALVLIRRRTAQ